MSEKVKCDHCYGTGKCIIHDYWYTEDDYGDGQYEGECYVCDGTGEIEE
jgi:hypothetical protein